MVRLLLILFAVVGTGCSLAAAKTPAPKTPQQAEVPRTSLGTNLTGIAYWSAELPFVDVFKTSGSWVSLDTVAGTWDDHRAIAVDANGWVTSLLPNQAVISLMLWDLDAKSVPGGHYDVTYEGEGDFTYFNATTLTSAPGHDVLDVVAGHGFGVRITRTEAGNPLRNFRILFPGGSCADDETKFCDATTACRAGERCVPFVERTPRFHPQFVERIRPYRALRFMDWMSTNHSAQSSWANRPKVTDARWSEKGVPLEVMLELARLLRVDPWFNIPHLATDEYVTQFATQVREGLPEGRVAYVEHSNEVWNTIMGQATYARDRGLALGLSTNATEAQLRYHAKRSVEIFRLWETAFGGTGRIIRVMGAFSVVPWFTQTLMDFPGALETTDALAIAPYFGHELGDPNDARYPDSRLPSFTPEVAIAELAADHLPRVLGEVAAQAQLMADYAAAAGRKIDLIGYEGGQHIVGRNGRESDAAWNARFDEINRAPAMKDLYEAYLAGWKAAGGNAFFHFVNCSRPSRYGRWGALEYQLQPRSEAPKFDALMTFLETIPPWW